MKDVDKELGETRKQDKWEKKDVNLEWQGEGNRSGGGGWEKRKKENEGRGQLLINGRQA